MSVTIDCGEGKHEICSGWGSHHFLIPQLNDGRRFRCACPCHDKGIEDEETPDDLAPTALLDRQHDRMEI